MNTDCTFQIGSEHQYCEDYAISSIFGNLAYAIVCDGCSASPDVDFGARVLAMSAKKILLKMMDAVDMHEPPYLFGACSIIAANRIFEIFPYLHSQALDATLNAAWVSDNKLTAVMYGDGVFIHKKKDDYTASFVQLSSGAPDYLSYMLDKNRMREYEGLTINNKMIFSKTKNTDITTTVSNPFVPVVVQCPVEKGDIIAVISDGMNSFRNQDDSSIAWYDLINEFAGFKSMEGEFVTRRLNAFKRKCLKEGIHHYDDISIAAIHV
jgi:hypothetical protein